MAPHWLAPGSFLNISPLTLDQEDTSVLDSFPELEENSFYNFME